MRMKRFLGGLAALLALLALLPMTAQAQEAPAKKQFPCGLGMVWNDGPAAIHPVAWSGSAGFRAIDAPGPQVRLSFVGHMTFLIRSPHGVKVVTDYNNYYMPPVLPDIATMNINRANHSRDVVDPAVKYVLRGWDTGNGIPHHDVRLKDVRVYNVPTDIVYEGARPTNYSSIFVIEAGGVCIAHLGHLAHVLDKEQVSRLGRIDVLLTPVDRQVTESFDELMVNLSAISPRLIIPMHFNSVYTVNDFLAQIGKRYPVKRLKSSTIELTRAMLPHKTEIWYMPSNFLSDFGGGGQL